MNSPTPQDFEKAKVKRWMLELAVDNTNHNEIIGAKLVPNEMGGWVMLEDYYRLESEKSLLEKEMFRHKHGKWLVEEWNAQLEKRVRELEEEINSRIEQHDFQLEARENMIAFNNDRIKALEADNERLKANIRMSDLNFNALEKQNIKLEDQIRELKGEVASEKEVREQHCADAVKLESRLAEAVRVLKNTRDVLGDEGKEWMPNACKTIDSFLNSPTNSKALEIARARDVEYRRLLQDCKDIVSWCRTESLSKEGRIENTINLLSEQIKRIEALDALSSGEGKVNK